MKLAIISDIHANRVALEAVLADLEREGIEQVVCLGDVAVGGPQPTQTVALLRSLGFPTVQGNMDAWALAPEPACEATGSQQKICEIELWGAGQLSEGDREYLRTFQPTVSVPLEGDECLLAYHGSPRSNQDALAAGTPEDQVARWLQGAEALVLAGGHTHTQMLRRFRSSLLINPGSVGLPFERRESGEVHSPAWGEYAIVSAWGVRLEVDFRRVPFDLEAFRRVTLESGLPHAAWWLSHWG